MGKIYSRLLMLAFVIWTSELLANPTEHAHGERVHTHKLPVTQGINHVHGKLPKGKYITSSEKTDTTQQPATPINQTSDKTQQSAVTSASTNNEHIHGHLFHTHPLPVIGVTHQHGKGTVGRPLIGPSDFTFKESTWASYGDQVESCALVFMSKGLSPKFNPYRDWGGLCNEIKDTKEFKDKVYKDYGKGGIFAYEGFERDYARLINMRVKDYEKVLTSSRPKSTYTGSSGGSVYVRGYYRKNGTYVRSHTRRRRR